MAIDPVTAMLIMQGTQTLLNFPFQRKAQKQTLQKLHTNRLLAQLNGEATSNAINNMADETIADNITIANSRGYDATDSNSFDAIQTQVNTKRDKDLTFNTISTNSAVADINASLSNLKDQMLMSEINFVTDLGSIWFSYDNYTSNKKVEEAYRAKVLKQLKEQTKILNETKKTSQMGYKKMLWRVKNQQRYSVNVYGKYRD